MSVKRYEWVACDEHSCHCDVVESAEGDMVDYEDYAALEARCAALAAENAGLKAAINEHSQCFTVCKCCGTENDCSNDDICRAVNEVPETDAFLAEVRASAVEEFVRMADYSESVADGEVIVTSSSVFAAGHEFAAQIRKGVQS